jgi:hypothetical protein
MVSPERLAEIEITRVGGRADDRASCCADGSASGWIARRCADNSAARGTDHSARKRTIARIGSATRKRDRRGKHTAQKQIVQAHRSLRNLSKPITGKTWRLFRA